MMEARSKLDGRISEMKAHGGPSIADMEREPDAVEAYWAAYPEEHERYQRAITEVIETQRKLREVVEESAEASLNASSNVLMQPISSALKAQYERTVRRIAEGLPDDADEFAKNFVDAYSAHKVSADFKGNEGAAERFRRWVEEAPENKGKRGTWTYSALARTLLVDRGTAKRFYENPSTITERAAFILKFIMGDAEYHDLIHGEGSCASMREDERRDEVIRSIERNFSEVVEYLRSQSLSEANECASLMNVVRTVTMKRG